MLVPSGKVPAYCRHKAFGQAVVRLDGRDHNLGPYGSPESHERYARLIAERQSRPHPKATETAIEGRRCQTNLSINEVMLAYVEFAAMYYTKDGTLNSCSDTCNFIWKANTMGDKGGKKDKDKSKKQKESQQKQQAKGKQDKNRSKP
jgi:hypothetical protein